VTVYTSNTDGGNGALISVAFAPGRSVGNRGRSVTNVRQSSGTMCVDDSCAHLLLVVYSG